MTGHCLVPHSYPHLLLLLLLSSESDNRAFSSEFARIAAMFSIDQRVGSKVHFAMLEYRATSEVYYRVRMIRRQVVTIQ